MKDFKKYATICQKVTCKKCGSKFVPDGDEIICIYCNQDPADEIYVKEQQEKRKKYRELMENKDKTFCKNCDCMTKIKKGYIYTCDKCNKDKRRNKRL